MDHHPAGTQAGAHVLFLMRHAKAEPSHPGVDDHRRELTDEGRHQAACAGAWLAGAGDPVGLALCSPAVRAAQTLQGLGLDTTTAHLWDLYNASADRILDTLHEVDEDVRTVLVVSHAPGIPTLARALAATADSDPDAHAAIAQHYPPATIVRLEFDGTWHDLEQARLTDAHLD